MKVTNWGKYPVIEKPEVSYHQGMSLNGSRWIARGMGRCYGDASLGDKMLSSLKLNRLIDFDEEKGILTCESGVTFEDILEIFVPKGWFPSVTPGTKFVTMGGALAADVHGKNHHKEGSFSDYVLNFLLMTASGEIIICSRTVNAEIFFATAGGMGLTGMILQVTIQLKKIETSAIRMQSIKARNLTEILSMFDEFESVTYSMAWIDCLAPGRRQGRSILLKGEHATLDEVKNSDWKNHPLKVPNKFKINIPFDFPSFVLNPFTTRIFNFLYYNRQVRQEVHLLGDYDGFFYPLDMIHNWNRIYGGRGFTQYQLVIPKEAGQEGITDVLNLIQKRGMASFLAVLKLLGNSNGLISFPVEGYTLALDFPLARDLFPFLDELDKVVVDYGGRLYLAKDVRMSPEMLAKTYPGLDEFKAIIKKLDPAGKIRSYQSERLGIHSIS
ncbi:MAG: FAD-binding oxidoreductase [Bacteroidia bacterium]